MPRLAPLLLVLLLCPSVSAPAQSGSDGFIRIEPTPELTVYRSKHYRIHSNLSRAEVVPFGRHVDAMFEQYDKRFRSLVSSPIEPMPVYLFRTEQQYDRFLQEHDIDATHSGGMFFVTHRLEGLATWVEGPSRRKTFEVLQHEGFHQFAWHAFGPKLPVWLNEGLAQYFESAVIRDGKLTLGLTSRARIEKVRQAIKADEALPLSELMTITGDEWARALRKNPGHSGLLYAQSWSLTYFLIHGDEGEHQRALYDYLERLAEGDRPDDALLLSFGTKTLRALDGRWRRHAYSQRPDDVAEAIERLEFLGTGLRLLAEQGEDMPDDLDGLRDTLRRYGFKLRRSEMGVTRHLSAERDELFQFTGSGDQSHDFVLLSPDRAGLPPRITAPGLEPEPTLIWYRDGDGKLVQDIAYE